MQQYRIKFEDKKTLEVLVKIQIRGKGKGKAIPLQDWTGPEVPRTLRVPDMRTIGA